MEKNKYTESMQRLADIQLIEMLSGDTSDMDPLALIAAKAELKSRELSVDDVAEVQNRIESKKEVNNEPLTSSEKLTFALFCWFPGSWTRTLMFRADGYEQKCLEARKIMRTGLFVLLLAIVLMVVVFR